MGFPLTARASEAPVLWVLGIWAEKRANWTKLAVDRHVTSSDGGAPCSVLKRYARPGPTER